MTGFDGLVQTLRSILRPYTSSISVIRDWQDSAPKILDVDGVEVATIHWQAKEMDMIRDISRQVDEYLISHKIWRGELNVCL